MQNRIKDVRRQLAEIEIANRAKTRSCAECGGCDTSTPCGWRKGLFLQAHRPDTMGLRLVGANLGAQKGGTVPVWIFYELRPDARHEEPGKTLVHQASRDGRVVLVVNVEGVWAWIGGPSEGVRWLLGDDPRLPAAGCTVAIELRPVEANTETPINPPELQKTRGGR